MTQVTASPALKTSKKRGGRAAEKALTTISGATLRALPHIPDRLKRVMLGGRSTTVDGNTLDTTLQLMLTGQQMLGLNGLVADDDPVVARTQLEVLAAGFQKHIPVASVTNLTVDGADGPINARHYRTDAEDAALLVFFHGGGHVIGSIDSHDDLCREICRSARIHVLSVDYRLAPEHKAPAGAQDAYAAYLWAREHAAELGADPDRIAVGGDSAGGNLSAVLTQRARDEGVPQPALQVLLYPATEVGIETRSQTLFSDGFFLTARDMDWFMSQFLDGSGVDATDPRVSPLRAGDLSGLAPALVVTAGFDPLRDEGRLYAEAMRAAGTPVDYREYGSVVHGFANFFPLGGDSATATADFISAIRAHLTRTG
ncbi:alpha/beta hydrolase [Mycolicibacterium parafortuitum]|uniref:Putative lipase/esterase LipN [Mycobacterium tuberculosis H37Rv] n=1 Tax=Mycolicibacterium parafortuitum TaxID=39692 RepID=A0A375YJK3_MYCPF|nr:alpha/beta hydrolase [Mycolicibacterium parafortuitum]ORB32492.1 lipase [Mycolicibacterium parafortuitum]SRX81223.1 putative lipase/esterase LipN [Mycobacterium tuberculosis H37Rv] [Mycolicibacterium parafortuitum]